MANYICKNCGINFKRDKSGERKIRFCSNLCNHDYRKKNNDYHGLFKKGQIPWNKNTKGVMKKNKTSFKKGMKSNRIMEVGSITIRVDKNGAPRAFIKVENPGVWKYLSVYVWEKENGEIKKGNVIHHIDKDSLNDSSENLQSLSRADHINIHRKDLTL